MRAQTETPTRQGPADWAIREDVCSRAVASVGVSVCSEYVEASNERSGECPECAQNVWALMKDAYNVYVLRVHRSLQQALRRMS